MSTYNTVYSAGWTFLLIFTVSPGQAVEPSVVPHPVDTVPLEVLDKEIPHHAGAEWPNDLVNTPLRPMVIRQGEDVQTAKYHEVNGYTFLLNSMKRPRLVRMDNGRLVLAATSWLHRTGEEVGMLMTSEDDGLSWSSPREVVHGDLTYLGGQKLMILGSKLVFSEDGGETWNKGQPFPNLADGRTPYSHCTFLVEGETVNGIFYVEEKPHGPVNWGGGSVILKSHDSGHTWEDPIFLPKKWQTSEGSLVRARDGALVVSLRTAQKPGYPSYSDHWRRITTARSHDEGKTWTDVNVYFSCGKVHTDLKNLPNGDILMTYAARIGELDGETYHGIEAVLSHDNGKTWDWANRYYLFRWNMQSAMHSPQSVVLSDGRVMTVFLYHYDSSYGKRYLPQALNIGMVDAIFWEPK